MIDERSKDYSEDYSEDMEEEIWEACRHAIAQLSMELPLSLLRFKVPDYSTMSLTGNTDGSGELTLPSDFVRLVALRLVGWHQTLYETSDPGSEPLLMQASRWGRGNGDKPVGVILGKGDTLQRERVLKYWSGTPTGSGYRHVLEYFAYVPSAIQSDEAEELDAPITESGWSAIVYRTAALYATGKKDTALAQAFMTISNYGHGMPSGQTETK